MVWTDPIKDSGTWHFIRLFIVYKVFSKKRSNTSIYIILQLETEVFGFLTSHTFSCTVTTYKLEIHKWELGDEFRTLRILAGVGWKDRKRVVDHDTLKGWLMWVVCLPLQSAFI